MKLLSILLISLAVCAVATEADVSKKKVKHVVVLMMENRSFDHMLGYMKGVDGVPTNQVCPIDPNDLSKGSVPIKPNGYDVSPDDPNHSFDAIAMQINGGGMDGFVESQLVLNQNLTNPVAMFTKDTAPIINTLAEEYAVFDRWFCSLPGPTDPNRQFAMSGTSRGATTNFNGTLYDQQTYIDYLRENGHSSGGYYQNDLWGLGAFEDLVKKRENFKNIKELDLHFYKDLAKGNLPEFTWLQPSLSALPSSTTGPTWQHPDASVMEGERLIKKIYESIRSSPIWEETLFLITYDENGGFYDHVPPPTNVPSPDGIDCFDCSTGYDFTTLGVRVPTVAISPYIKRGTVVGKGTSKEEPSADRIFDSTSIMSTSNELLGVHAPPLGARMAAASTFTNIISDTLRPDDDCPKLLPELPPTPENIVEIQRTKPINEHIHASLLFFCNHNYPQQFVAGELCAASQAASLNQGTASDWLKVEQDKFMVKRQKLLDNLA